MTLTEKQLPRIVLTLLILLTLIAGIVTYLRPMAIFPDPSWGFQVMKAMEHGHGFNMKVVPDQQDINENYAEFLSWWSPGQYLVPYVFRTLFHLNIGQASAVTILVCEILGLLGFYSFFRKAGFSRNISAISIAFIASQLFYVSPYVFYNGGEVLLFGFMGWFLYGCLSFSKANDWRLLLFILLSGLMGFCCKSSFMWMFGAALCFLWINISLPEKKPVKWIVNGIWLGIPAVAAVAVIYLGYLSRGLTPASGNNPLKLLWETFGYPLASPLLSGFSIDELTLGLLYHPDGPMFSYAVSVLIIVLLAALSVAIFIAILKKVPYQSYKTLLTVFYVAAVLFFGYSYLKQLAISYEGRHFRIIGLIFIPGVIYLVSRLKIGYRVLFGLLWAGLLIASLKYVSTGYRVNRDENSHGVSGITQQFLDQKSLNTLINLDRTHTNAIFVFTSPDLGLEVEHNRYITIDPVPVDLKYSLMDNLHCGHGGPLYIFLPADCEGKRAETILKCFEDYHNFKETKITGDYIMYSAD
ncbi:hypothetical protein MUY27_06795 [Mucilaginibacter sp. RS28]|uniref:Dolichyl-phosphate-mannose-protein mannosyltransferase n=1 Tax=Mucilaginibacter straminoryzae TaxID=2932774 RepID=A0A9X1X226_9SPHI|nr:hypothetical protein [Mucilaginibacter straminoryzae]MCJ8209411.1 hypothetical protein [Mucilaginibacter straminoryzae]